MEKEEKYEMDEEKRSKRVKSENNNETCPDP